MFRAVSFNMLRMSGLGMFDCEVKSKSGKGYVCSKHTTHFQWYLIPAINHKGDTKMNSARVKLFMSKVETLKLVKASLEAGLVEKFFATINAASQLGEFDTTLNGYRLADYELATAFSGVVQPRIVKLLPGYGMLELRKLDTVKGELLTPAEFKEVQLIIFNQFKKVPTFETNLEQASEPKLLTDVLNCVKTKDGVLVDGPVKCLPVALNFNFCKEGIGAMRQGEFDLELIYSIINAIKA